MLKNILLIKNLSSRTELILKKNKIIIIDDSKATNSNSVAKILKKFKHIHWIIGGKIKERNIKHLKKYLINVEHCYVMGIMRNKILTFLKKENKNYTQFFNFIDILFLVKKQINRGVLLLSPIGSSLNHWLNFKERGNEFKDIIYKLFI